MAAIYITSMGGAAGKSSLVAALGRKLQANGKKVGFLKPVCGAADEDRDAECMKALLGLEEPVESLCAVSNGVAELASTLDEKEPAWLKSVQDACASVSRGRDTVLLEGLPGFEAGSDSARISGRIVEALQAKALLVVAYEPDLDRDRIVAASRMFGDALLGVVINAVPDRVMEAVKTRIVASLKEDGIKVLGVLPEDRALFGVTVGELAEHVGGSILNSQERSDELVEGLMIGAMSMDSALSYLGLKSNKAVVTRGDRPDIQLAALETSTRCLVLTGTSEPPPSILMRAQELEVPIVMVEKDTAGTMELLEHVFDRTSFCGERKLERMGRILQSDLDLEAVYAVA